MKNNVDDTKIYKVYLELISYIEMICEKFPKEAKNGFVITLKEYLYKGMEDILIAYKEFDKNTKLKYLSSLDIKLKMLKMFDRISYKKKYINIRNYEAWSRKINNVCICLGGWINSCLRQ